jgi:cellulose synthase/poly-beta-1,6-N-acetylglucosamine synthase-like glycosyltransferase
MFRRDIFLSIGGHNVSSAEDLELTLRMRELGYRARFVSNAIATVDAPISLEALIKQRNRWDYNNLKLRLLMNQDYYLYKSGETLANALARADFMLCDFIPTISFPFYLGWLYWSIGDLTVTYILSIYILLLTVYIFNLALCLITTRQTFGITNTTVIPIFPLYIGVILKVSRFIAYSNEILFSVSFNDKHIPSRIRRAIFGQENR